MNHPPEMLKYVTDVAEALKDVANREVCGDLMYVLEVKFGYAGEDSDTYRLVPNDFDGLDVEIS